MTAALEALRHPKSAALTQAWKACSTREGNITFFRQAQGRLFRKGRERWGTRFVFHGY
ncbi:MAG: hypothetical protein WBP98_15045 [Candidatus Sulfotelmatobacter sp.]